jgi:hypothetical protein
MFLSGGGSNLVADHEISHALDQRVHHRQPPPLFVAGALEASCFWLIPAVHQLDPATVNGVIDALRQSGQAPEIC